MTNTLPDGRVINYTYDANGNVTSITPPGRPAHAFAYTPVDLESTYNPPNIGLPNDVTQYAYNLDKDLTQITRPDGSVITFSYDTTGRLVAISSPTESITYSFDPKGNIAGISTGSGFGLAYTWDGFLMTGENWTRPFTASVSRTYDTNFQLASILVNGGNTITYTRDQDGLETQVGSLRINRDPSNGFVIGTTLGTISDSFAYSAFGELVSYKAPGLYGVRYIRDALGRIVSKTETIGGVTDIYNYTYDTAGRLTDVSKNGAVVSSYVYDANGNRITATVNGVTSQGFYDLQDRMITYGGATYTYTANGELASKIDATGATVYGYDEFGNLRTVTLPNGNLISYEIDGRSRIAGKKINGAVVRRFVYLDELNPVAELDSAGSLVSLFVYGARGNVPDYMVKGGTTYRVISDNLGSVRLVIDTATGTVIQRIDYDEFGNVTLDTNPGFQPFGFAGGLYDQHTKLTRFGARDYDATTGRWTAKDPIRFDGGDTNLYGYVVNDPINSLDSNGLHKEDRGLKGYPRKFKSWYHRQWKLSGDRDGIPSEIKEAYKEWKREGEPGPDSKRRRPKGKNKLPKGRGGSPRGFGPLRTPIILFPCNDLKSCCAIFGSLLPACHCNDGA